MLKLRVRIEAEKPTDLLAVQSAKIWRVSALLAAYYIDEQAALDRSIVKMQTQRVARAHRAGYLSGTCIVHTPHMCDIFHTARPLLLSDLSARCSKYE